MPQHYITIVIIVMITNALAPASAAASAAAKGNVMISLNTSCGDALCTWNISTTASPGSDDWAAGAGTLVLGVTDDPYVETFRAKWDIIHYVTPIFFALGIIGNAMAFAVFAKRLQRLIASGVPKRLEQCATCGLLFLTASDLLVCICGIPSAFTSIEPFGSAHDTADLVRLRYIMLKAALINLWMFTSTWMTCLLCVQRCLGVCYPVRFTSVVNLPRTAVANLTIIVSALAINAPAFFRYTLSCLEDEEESNEDFLASPARPRVTCYVMPSSLFIRRSAYVAYYVTWSVVGGIIPVVVMAICNSKLLAAVRRKTHIHHSSSSSLVLKETSMKRAERRRNKAQQTTFLLVLITSVYLLLVTPSLAVNLLVLLMHGSTDTAYAGYQMVLVLLNLAQVANFSTSFIVCVAFSSSFRAHFMRMFKHQSKSRSTNRRSPPVKASPRDHVHTSTRPIIALMQQPVI